MPVADFEIAYGETELREGGYVNDPTDRGGETCRGVARKFHAAWPGWPIVDQIKSDHPDDFIHRIDADPQLAELAKQFFRDRFWQPILGDEIPNQHVANKRFDTGVNQGVAKSVRDLQDGVNLLNRNGRNDADIEVDGKMGPMTLVSLTALLDLEKGQPDYLLKLLNIMQAVRYLEVLRNDPTQERFARGWLNRVDLR